MPSRARRSKVPVSPATLAKARLRSLEASSLASDWPASVPAVTLPLLSVLLAVSLSIIPCVLLNSSRKSVIAFLMASLSLLTSTVDSPILSAVMDSPDMPDDSSVIVFEVLVSVPPPLTVYDRFLPRVSDPPPKPVAARKLPVTSSKPIPRSPVTLLVNESRSFTGS